MLRATSTLWAKTWTVGLLVIFSTAAVPCFAGTDEDQLEVEEGFERLEEDQSQTGLMQLPPELRLHIYNHLSVKDLLSISTISRADHEIALDESLWREKAQVLGLMKSENETYVTLVKKFYVSAVSKLFELKAKGLGRGKYGYLKNELAAQVLIEEGIRLGFPWAFEEKAHGLNYGSYGYQRDRISARDFIEEGIKQKLSWAFEKKASGLIMGTYGYNQDRALLHSHIDEGIKLGFPWAYKIKYDGLVNGSYDYRKYRIEADEVFEEAVKQRVPWALKIQSHHSILKRFYDHEKYRFAIRTFIEKGVNRGLLWTFEMKLEGLNTGRYGYNQSLTAAHDFIEERAKQRQPWAFEMKLEGLSTGKYGYDQSLTAAHDFIESALQEIKIEMGDGVREGPEVENNGSS